MPYTSFRKETEGVLLLSNKFRYKKKNATDQTSRHQDSRAASTCVPYEWHHHEDYSVRIPIMILLPPELLVAFLAC